MAPKKTITKAKSKYKSITDTMHTENEKLASMIPRRLIDCHHIEERLADEDPFKDLGDYFYIRDMKGGHIVKHAKVQARLLACGFVYSEEHRLWYMVRPLGKTLDRSTFTLSDSEHGVRMPNSRNF